MAKINYREQIQQIAVRRGIPWLCHFTPAPNLPSIIEYGLLSRTHLSMIGLSTHTSIDQRLDGNNQAISVSISATNHKMFKKKRAESGRDDWIVLHLCPSILWKLDCRFYRRNAARNDMRSRRGFRGSGRWAFNEMFSERSSLPYGFTGDSYRADTGIPDFLTTYSDAEIQVLQPIHPDCVVGALASNKPLAEIVNGSLTRLNGPERDVSVWDFSPRFENDFDVWG